MKLQRKMRLALYTAFVAVSTIALAGPLTPSTYVEIEMLIRQFTNEGMEQRLFLLKLQNDDSAEDQQDLDAEIVSNIDDVFRKYGTNAGKHTAYGTQNAGAIAQYLLDNPTTNQQLESIGQEFQRLSSLISAELGNN